MKIDKPNKPGAIPENRLPAREKPAPEAPRAAGSTQVEWTDEAARLQALEQALRQIGSIDTARVETIRQAIREGRYPINPEAIADGMLERAVEILLHGRTP